ncbi:RNA polymerase sigma factor [Pseudonocardia sp. MH-G8]|uniref:RNA polymerase sigma factor n=1 Tax=Pseudonocardia sp. MH-G8 TaxID=1854588 RepID=UPI00130405D4|nr:sigma factor-like helix-turn-helix DNA-binding protein [Pseudonocardia sp. MH-G8]
MSAAVDHRADPDDALRDDAEGSPATGDDEVRQPFGGTPAELRVDFGAHLEANYQRLVAQLYAITLDPGEAHDVVQDAYSRAWRSWVAIGRTPDPSAWIRRVAVRSTIRTWRRWFSRRRRAIGTGADARTRALLAALGRLSPAERRAVVLFHMADASVEEIAAIEQASVTLVQARLSRARHVVTEGMADVLQDVLGGAGDSDHRGDDPGYEASRGGYAEGYGLDGPGSGSYGAAESYGPAGTYEADGRDDEGERR